MSVADERDGPSAAAAAGRRNVLLLSLALALLTLIAFAPALDDGFVNFDDDRYVTAAPYREVGLSWRSAAWAFTSFHDSNWIPLTLLSHMLDLELFGLDPRGHHLTSVVLHAANVVLLFLVLRAMTAGLGASAVWKSAAAVAVFAVHPLRVESVVWVAERKDVLSAFFWILTLAAYLHWNRRPSWLSYAGVAVVFSLGLMAKPMLVTLPATLVLLDVWPLARLRLERAALWGDLGRRTLEKAPLLVLAVAAGAIALAAQRGTIAHSAPQPFAARAANAVVAYAVYLGKTVAPRGLAVFYPFPEHLPMWQTVAAGALLAALSVVAVLARRRAPALLVGWCWFLGALVPVIGLLKVGDQAFADRYTYLPSIGLALAAAWGLPALLGRRSHKALAAGGAVAVVVLVLLTRGQAGVWRSSETLFRHALAVTEDNEVAHVNLAEALRVDGRLGEAVEHFRTADALRPSDVEAQAGLAQVLRLSGRRQEALEHLETAAELAPEDVRVLLALAMAQGDLGRDAEAIATLERLLAIDPRSLEAHWGLGELLARRGDVPGAREHLRAALALDPEREALRAAVRALEGR